MPRRAIEERVRAKVERCRPCSHGGRFLLDLYVHACRWDGAAGTVENLLVDLGEVCRMVEEVSFDPLALEALDAAARRPAPSPTAAARRRRVVNRLRRRLRHDHLLPSRAEVRAGERLRAELAATPAAGRDRLERWLRRRQFQLGAHELAQEATRMRKLEQLLAASPALDPCDLSSEWVRGLVRSIVDCSCPPVTRIADPAVCTACGATAASAGLRPSPGPPKQQSLRAVGRAYLAFHGLEQERER